MRTTGKGAVAVLERRLRGVRNTKERCKGSGVKGTYTTTRECVLLGKLGGAAPWGGEGGVSYGVKRSRIQFPTYKTDVAEKNDE